LDECVHYPCAKEQAKIAMERTVEWAKRSKEQVTRSQGHKVTS